MLLRMMSFCALPEERLRLGEGQFLPDLEGRFGFSGSDLLLSSSLFGLLVFA